MSEEHVIIKIALVGTKGQLDKPETEYVVRYIQDQAERAKRYILSLKEKYPDFGWTMITAEKSLGEQ